MSSLMTARARRRLRGYTNARISNGKLSAIDLEDVSFEVEILVYGLHDIDKSKRQTVASSIAAKLKPGGVLWVLKPTKMGHGIQVAELRRLMDDAGMQEISAESRKSSYRGRFINR